MSIGSIVLVIAAALFFLAGIGANLIPNETTWGLFFLTLGLLLGGYRLPSSIRVVP